MAGSFAKLLHISHYFLSATSKIVSDEVHALLRNLAGKKWSWKKTSICIISTIRKVKFSCSVTFLVDTSQNGIEIDEIPKLNRSSMTLKCETENLNSSLFLCFFARFPSLFVKTLILKIEVISYSCECKL